MATVFWAEGEEAEVEVILFDDAHWYAKLWLGSPSSVPDSLQARSLAANHQILLQSLEIKQNYTYFFVKLGSMYDIRIDMFVT